MSDLDDQTMIVRVIANLDEFTIWFRKNPRWHSKVILLAKDKNGKYNNLDMEDILAQRQALREQVLGALPSRARRLRRDSLLKLSSYQKGYNACLDQTRTNLERIFEEE